MVFNRLAMLFGLAWPVSILAISIGLQARGSTSLPETPAVVQKISAANTKVEMTVNSSRILSMDRPIPRAQVANPELLDFTVLSENQVQIHAKKAGITTDQPVGRQRAKSTPST